MVKSFWGPREVRFAAGVACLGLALLVSGCGSRRPAARKSPAPPMQPAPSPTTETAGRASAPVPGGKPSTEYNEEGNASWYGAPFHGRRASNGEVYDMYKLTAAHRTLPFETVVRVTNVTNGKSTTVRITDRGPFVANRIIDLSLAAAKEIDSVGPGVVPVRLEILSAIDPNSGYFTVQIGAFRDRGNAERLRDRLSPGYSPIFIQQVATAEGPFFRVRVGKVSGEEAAHQLGEQLRAKEGGTPMVFRLDGAAAEEGSN